MTTQKDDYIKQLTEIAGYTCVTLDVTLFITQIEAMLNAAYDAGQRDQPQSIPTLLKLQAF